MAARSGRLEHWANETSSPSELEAAPLSLLGSEMLLMRIIAASRGSSLA